MATPQQMDRCASRIGRNGSVHRTGVSEGEAMRSVLLGCLLLVSAPSPGADWTMLGGDMARSSRSSDPVPDHPRKLWSTDLGATVFASPVAGGRSVYFVAHDQQIHALDALTGKPQWRYATDGPISATPILLGDAIVVVNKEGVVSAHELRDGKLRWQRRFGGRILSSPVADAGVIYFGCNDLFLYAVRNDGKILWAYYARDYKYGGLYGAPALDSRRVYIGAKNGVLHAVWRENGRGAWRATLGSSIYGPPLVSDGRIFVGAYDRHVYALAADTGKVLWKTRLDDWPQGGLTRVDQRLYVATRNGRLHALDVDSGSLAWSESMGGELRHGPVVGANGIGVLGSQAGQLIAVDMQTGKPVWQRNVVGPVTAAPAITEHAVFVATRNGEVSAWH